MSVPPPGVVYPYPSPAAVVYPVTVSEPQPSSHHSNGSFGTVFIVLAVITVISAVACVLGRVCNRRFQEVVKAKAAVSPNHAGPRPRDREPPELSFRHKQNGPGFNFGPNKEKDPEFGFRPKERDPGFNPRPIKVRDVELGLDKGGGIRVAKPGGNGDPRGVGQVQNGNFLKPAHGHGHGHGHGVEFGVSG